MVDVALCNGFVVSKYLLELSLNFIEVRESVSQLLTSFDHSRLSQDKPVAT